MPDNRFFSIAAGWIAGLTVLMLSATAPPALAQESKTESADKPNVKLPPAKEIIAKFIKATGGEQARLKHFSSHSKGTMSMPATGMSGALETFAAKPNRMMIKVDMPGIGMMSRGFDGKVAWSIDPRMGLSVQEGAEREQTRIAADYYGEIRKDKLYESMETVDLTEFEGKQCYKIKLVPREGPPVFEFYEVQSGLRRGSQGTAVTATGEMPVTSIESEYKQMGDFLVATMTVQKMMMREVVIKIESIEYDKVDYSVFKLPQEIETPAKQIIARYIKATGGEQARLKHSSSHTMGTMSVPATGMSGTLEAFGAKPNRMLIKVDMQGMGLLSQGFDGKVGWSIHPMVGPSIDEGLQLEQTRIAADYYGEIRKDKLYKSIQTVDLIEFEGKQCYKIKLVPEQGPPVFEFYEVQSGLRRGSQITAVTAMGEMAVTHVESEYKKMGDLMIATKTVQTLPMQEVVIKIESIEYDKVDDAVFKLPPEIEALANEAKSEPKQP